MDTCYRYAIYVLSIARSILPSEEMSIFLIALACHYIDIYRVHSLHALIYILSTSSPFTPFTPFTPFNPI